MTAAAGPTRVLGLDAVRGLAILMMCLSGIVPRWLPNWMYHGYYPQRLRDADGIWQPVYHPWTFWTGSAFTWVDWVFPMFLFAMGAAIPLAMAGRLKRGVSRLALVRGTFVRFAILLVFAVYVQQITPHYVGTADPSGITAVDYLLALAGFALLFPCLMRLPRTTPPKVAIGVRIAGVVLAIGLVALIHFRRDTAFNWNDKDIIILLLAWMALFAGLLWVALPGRWWPLRLAIGLFIAYAAHHQAMSEPWRYFDTPFDRQMALFNEWPHAVLNLTWLIDHPGFDLSPLWNYTWLKFLWVVLPGTVVGDRLARFIADRDAPAEPARPLLAHAALHLLAIGIVLFAYSARLGELIQLGGTGVATRSWLIAAAALVPAIAALALVRKDPSAIARLCRDLSLWAIVLLMLGLSCEPWEGGIKKGPPSTLSWYLIAAALTVNLLAASVVLIDASKRGRFWLGWLVLNGQNPMLAYVGIRNLLDPAVKFPIFAPLRGTNAPDSVEGVVVHDLIDHNGSDPDSPTRWLVLIWALLKTAALAAVVAVATQRRLVWRS
ncbi:MAG: DUF5009 domain-containing protein [Planctomycetota bacterium]